MDRKNRHTYCDSKDAGFDHIPDFEHSTEKGSVLYKIRRNEISVMMFFRLFHPILV